MPVGCLLGSLTHTTIALLRSEADLAAATGRDLLRFPSVLTDQLVGQVILSRAMLWLDSVTACAELSNVVL